MATAKTKSKTATKSGKTAVKKTVAKAAPKTAKAKKPAAKPAAKKLAPKAKPVPKTAKKPTPKTASKPKAKVPPKTAKVAAKSVAKKPVAKPVAKPAGKPVVKPAAKPAAKPAIKVPVKPVAKIAPPKAPSKDKPAAGVAKPGTAAPITRPSAGGHGVAPVIATSPLGTPLPKIVPKPTPKPAPIKEPVFKITPSTVREGGTMSEAEILKQPKNDYMNKAQLAFFRQRLLTLQNQLRENAGATTEHLREISVAPDPADRATLEEEHALELRTRDRERKLLKKVESALERIADGSYGYCEETGEPIGIPRLLARPTATLTIEAQERRELKQRMYGE